jgi:hypothetical protein
MQPIHGFYMYRVFISAPGDLASDRDACRAAISEINEHEAMPSKILLVSVGLQSDDQIMGYRAAVADNVRAATYYVQIFQDDWGPRNLFRKIFLLALEGRDDPAMPMRNVVVCLKDAPAETDREILDFRAELEAVANVRLVRYSSLSELKENLRSIFSGWVTILRQECGTSAAGTAG